GSWNRPAFADMARYPGYRAMMQAQADASEHVSNRDGVPKAVGEVRYLDRALIETECRDFRAALGVEYEAISNAGFLLQIDAPDLAMERHITYQDRPLGDFLGFSERVIDTINNALVNVPRERVRLHVCWGNYEGPHDCDVPLDDILPVLKHARVGALVLPFANPRHAHEVRALKQVPEDQMVVAGVIDTVTNYI